MAVEVLQLPLHGAADAAAVAAVQPVAHHAQAVVPLLPVEGKVLHLGGDAPAALGPGGRGAALLLPAGEGGSQPGRNRRPGEPPAGRSPPPPAGATAQNSQRDLHPIGGDWRGRVWDPPEVAGGEWGRLKHIVCHGAHFFLGWGWSGRHRKRQCEESLSPILPLAAQFKGRTGRLFGRKVKGSCVSAMMVTFLASTLSHPRVLVLRDRKTGAQELRKVAHPIPSTGLWLSWGHLAQHGQGQVTSPSSQATLPPCPKGPHPMLALLKNEESNVSAPSTTSSSRKLG